MTHEEIAEKAAKRVCESNGIKKNGSRKWVTALCWALGEDIEYEKGVRQLVTETLRIKEDA